MSPQLSIGVELSIDHRFSVQLSLSGGPYWSLDGDGAVRGEFNAGIGPKFVF